MTLPFVALPDIGVTVTPTDVLLGSTTLDLPAIGVTLAFIGVSLGSTVTTSVVSGVVFNFQNYTTQSQYIPVLLGGFA